MCVLFLGSLSQCNILLRWQQFNTVYNSWSCGSHDTLLQCNFNRCRNTVYPPDLQLLADKWIKTITYTIKAIIQSNSSSFISSDSLCNEWLAELILSE